MQEGFQDLRVPGNIFSILLMAHMRSFETPKVGAICIRTCNVTNYGFSPLSDVSGT